jgi:membrane protein implicated in regulation of membrane protease activity
LLVTLHAHYGALRVALIVLATLRIIWLLRSAIGPALSAGVLPMVLDERHWMYPLAIGVGLTGLVLLLWVWQRYSASTEPSQEEATEASIDDALEPIGRRSVLLQTRTESSAFTDLTELAATCGGAVGVWIPTKRFRLGHTLRTRLDLLMQQSQCFARWKRKYR